MGSASSPGSASITALISAVRRVPEHAEPGEGGRHRVTPRNRVLEDHHEAVARRLVDVATLPEDLVEKRAEVALDQVVQAGCIEAVAQPAVADDVDEEDGQVDVALGERGRLGRALDQVLDDPRHDLGQVRADGSRICTRRSAASRAR